MGCLGPVGGHRQHSPWSLMWWHKLVLVSSTWCHVISLISDRQGLPSNHKFHNIVQDGLTPKCADFPADSGSHKILTFLTQLMADEFNFLWSQTQNYLAEANADLIPVIGKLELHGRCRCGVLLSPCFGALVVADLTVGVKELGLHYRCRGRFNFRKFRIAPIAVMMVVRKSGSRF